MLRRPRGPRRGDDLLAPPRHLGRRVAVGGEDDRHARGDELRRGAPARGTPRPPACAAPRSRPRPPTPAARAASTAASSAASHSGGRWCPNFFGRSKCVITSKRPVAAAFAEEPVVLVPEVRRALASRAVRPAPGASIQPPATKWTDPRTTSHVVRREERRASAVLVPLGVVGLDAEEDVDPARGTPRAARGPPRRSRAARPASSRAPGSGSSPGRK